MIREIWKDESGRVYAIGRYYYSTEQAQQDWAERVTDGRETDPTDTPEYEAV